MGFWERFTAGRNSVNGHAPDPPPAAPPVVELAPVVPPTEPRMSTDLGDALTAYWPAGSGGAARSSSRG
jgi:hypothetical protein